MTSEDRQKSASGEVDTKQACTKRRRWPLEVKRRLVAETLEPGSSVSIVARRHDVNANQLFKWRHEFAEPTALVPVTVVPEPGPAAPEPSMVSGRIEIVLSGGVRVKIEGAVDPVAVTAAVAAVMKARRRR